MSDKLKCPSCDWPVGNPVRPGVALDKRIEISPKDLMICCKCFEFMQGKDDGGLRILTSKERAYLLLHRGAELIHFIKAAAVGAQADEKERN